MIDDEIVELLTEIQFIGPFPKGMTVLLVPIQNAVDEAKLIDSNLTRKSLATLLKKKNTFVFRDVEEYAEVLKGTKASI